MAKLFEWIRSASAKMFDPKREQRVAAFADEAWCQLIQQRQSFDLQRLMHGYGAEPEDIPLVADRVYDSALRKAWGDGVMTDKEKQSLSVMAKLLGLTPKIAQQIDWRVGLRVFQERLGAAFADGSISEDEAAYLDHVAETLGVSVADLMNHYFLGEGKGFLRNMFVEMMQGQAFSGGEWQKLIGATRLLGLSEQQLQEFVRPQAQQYVEHVLADAKADESIDASERRAIAWLLDTFNLPSTVRDYVAGEIASVDAFESIRAGRLPSVAGNGVELRSGEIVHLQTQSVYGRIRQLQNGTRIDRHEGLLTITDNRLLFSGPTKSFELSHRRVVSLLPSEHLIEVRAGGKGGGYYGLPRIGQAIYEVAVKKANQTIVEAGGAQYSRHIPRDVRQRVWQRYGGHCAECRDDRYLEFDHIVPVAKGGSNGDANVQLLCRGCNGKKSDRI